MTDVLINLGTFGNRVDAELKLGIEDPEAAVPEKLWENISTFSIGDYVVIDGIPRADEAGADLATKAGATGITAVTTPLDPVTLFPDSYAHWIGGSAYQAWDVTNTLYRWWPVQFNASRLDTEPRMSFFLGQDAGSGGLQYAAVPAFNGLLPPYQDDSYTYQGYGRSMARAAAIFPGGGYAKIDPEANFPSATLAITAVLHPSQLPYFGIFEAAKYTDPTSEVVIGDPMVLRWHHGQLRLYHDDRQVLSHESHRRSAAPIVLLVSLDSATDTGRLYALDQNRTTRTFNTVGLETIALLGIFGGLGQGKTTDRYRFFAEMDVLDVAIWNYAMDWPEMESKANKLSLAYGVNA